MMQRIFTQQTAEEARDSVCTVQMGGERFAVRLTDVVEVVTAAQISPYPLSPEYVAGLMHYRGDVLTVVHLRSLLGLPASAQTKAGNVCVVMAGTHGLFALQVEDMGAVHALEASKLQIVPATTDAQRHVFLRGVYPLDSELLPLLDVQRLEPVALRAWAAAHVHETTAAGSHPQQAMAS